MKVKSSVRLKLTYLAPYKGHYVGEESKVQTLDLIDSIGDS